MKVVVSALPLIACAWLLAGCGLAEVGASAAATGASAAEQAKQGKEMEDKVQKQLDAASCVGHLALRFSLSVPEALPGR